MKLGARILLESKEGLVYLDKEPDGNGGYRMAYNLIQGRESFDYTKQKKDKLKRKIKKLKRKLKDMKE